MARGRMINQKISEDLDFNSMSMEAQFLFMRTLPFLDRDGLINGHPVLLFSKIAPLMPQLATTIGAMIDEWISAGFVIRYNDGKHTVLFFKGFASNQANMRYDREGKSDFGQPPGYIRTSTGLTPEGDGNPDDNQPPNDDDLCVTGEKNSTPELLRQSSGKAPLEVKDQDQVKGEYNAREETAESTDDFTPPPLANNEYMPGLPDPRKSKSSRSDITERFVEAKQLGVSAEQYRTNVDALLLGFGKKAMVDAGNDKALYFAQELALKIMRMSEKFRDAAGIESIFKSWSVDDWRGRKGEIPTSEQLEEHASAMADGKLVKPTNGMAPGQFTFKQWCLRTYNADSPIVIGIPLESLKAQYEQATRTH